MNVTEQVQEWCFTALGDLGRWINQQEYTTNLPQLECGNSLGDERYFRNPTVKFFSTLISRSIALQKGYEPSKEWLENGHFQTIYSMINSTIKEKLLVKCLDVRMTLEHAWDGSFQGVANPNTTFHSRYGYQLHVDVFPSHLEDSIPTPTLILIGLDNGSSLGPGHSHQLNQQRVALMKMAYAKKGWRTVSIQSIAPLPPSHFTSIDRSSNHDNWQNAVRESITNQCQSNSNPPSSHDIRVAIEWLALRFKDSKLIAVSHFLGANAVVKYLGEVGCHTPLIGAISIANPFDIKSLSNHLQAQSDEISPINRYIYSPALEVGRKAHFIYEFAKHQYHIWNQLLGVLSGSVSPQPLPELILDTKPVTNDNRSSCEPFLKNVTLPLLCIQSLDDPFLPKLTIPYSIIAQSPYIHLVTTQFGGHLGWHQLKHTSSKKTNRLIQDAPRSVTPRFISPSRATTALSTLSPQLPTSSASSSTSNSFISPPPPPMPQPTATMEVMDQWSHQVILDFASLAFARFTKLKW